jgi:hypothetical protein
MSNNLTEGVIQVGDVSVFSINAALMQVLERLDHLKGLRGRSETWDRHRVESPAAARDAVDLGSLENREALFHVTLLATTCGLVVTPGTTYAEISTLLRQPINFATPVGLEGRLIASAWGTEAGSGKGLALTDASGTVLVETTWSGTDEEVRVGTFTSIDVDTDTVTRLYARASSATETLIITTAAVELRFDSGASVST